MFVNKELMHKLFYTCDYCDHTNKGSALIIPDFRKAFDTVEWSFRISVLRHSVFKNLYTLD